MKILFVADGRSPIALNWINYWVDHGSPVHLVSTYPCEQPAGLESFHVIPVAFSQAAGSAASSRKGGALRRLLPVGLRTALRQRLGPFTLGAAAQHLRQVVEKVRPDLVHAMRIPYEGMLAALALESIPTPLLLSVWGNDFTLHAPASASLGQLTRRALSRANGLHADCQRDVRLAQAWGFSMQRPSVVLPGAGGVQSALFHPPSGGETPGAPLVINPRGLRTYVRSDTFFRSIPLILESQPAVRFICPSMEGESEAVSWVESLGVFSQVKLLPHQTRPQMAELFRQSQVAVSPSVHDGTPNTLLEAMACGCFPVAGDIEALREWITPGVNGLLVDPGDPHALADAVLLALSLPEMRFRAAQENAKLITSKAEYGTVMRQAESFYQSLLT